jgi:hypothetical protein
VHVGLAGTDREPFIYRGAERDLFQKALRNPEDRHDAARPTSHDGRPEHVRRSVPKRTAALAWPITASKEAVAWDFAPTAGRAADALGNDRRNVRIGNADILGLSACVGTGEVGISEQSRARICGENPNCINNPTTGSQA